MFVKQHCKTETLNKETDLVRKQNSAFAVAMTLLTLSVVSGVEVVAQSYDMINALRHCMPHPLMHFSVIPVQTLITYLYPLVVRFTTPIY